MKENTTGCAEYQSLSRRDMLSSIGALASAWLPQVAYTEQVTPFASSTPRDIVVTVFLRGGADGFALCAPYADSLYSVYRVKTAMGTPGSADPLKAAIDLDGFFGFPPAMAALVPYFKNKNLFIAHQAGSTNPTRSHFEAQNFMEAGKEDMNLYSGWMGRHLASVAEQKAGASLRAFALATQMPLTLEGSPKASVISDLTKVQFASGDPVMTSRILTALSAAYATADPHLQTAASNTRKTIDVLQNLNYANYKPGGGAVYNAPIVSTLANGTHPTTPIPPSIAPFGNALSASAAMIKAGIGIESIHIDFNGWDSHQYEHIFEQRDPVTGGAVFGGLVYYLNALSSNLAAFFKDLDSVTVAPGKTLMDRVTVVVMTEFGRTVNENGNQGTDHGQGGVIMFLGKNVNGGIVDRQWLPLGNGGIDNAGGLAVTLDYKLYLGELLEKRLQNGAQMSTVFPGFTKPASGWRGAFK